MTALPSCPAPVIPVAPRLPSQLHRTTFADKASFSQVLTRCPNLRKLCVQDADWTNWDDVAAAASIASLRQLQELRLQNSEASAERNPFASTARVLRVLPALRKLTLFTRLDAASLGDFVAYLNDRTASKRLFKLKVSTGLLAGAGGNDVLTAVATHVALSKLTIVRPEGMGDPLRKAQCSLLSAAMVRNTRLTALHLRRCGMWTDTLSALVPPAECPHIKRLKLDGNSLGYLSGAYFNEAMDTLLSRLPNLAALHLGNNQLDPRQAEGLAASLTRHHIDKLENLTMGSNDIGDAGLGAILAALPPTMKQVRAADDHAGGAQRRHGAHTALTLARSPPSPASQLYIHGVDCTDASLTALREAMDRWPELWGLGLNGNPITDAGARALARALRDRPSLRDVGITLSEMTDEGVGKLAKALRSCANLRYVYLYTTGFKAAQKVTEEAKRNLRAQLPLYATAAFDHRLSRYLKRP